MEKGKVSMFSASNSSGTIMDGQGRSLGFTSSSYVGRDRSSLKMGDAVWFERIGINAASKAINVRRC